MAYLEKILLCNCMQSQSTYAILTSLENTPYPSCLAILIVEYNHEIIDVEYINEVLLKIKYIADLKRTSAGTFDLLALHETTDAKKIDIYNRYYIDISPLPPKGHERGDILRGNTISLLNSVVSDHNETKSIIVKYGDKRAETKINKPINFDIIAFTIVKAVGNIVMKECQTYEITPQSIMWESGKLTMDITIVYKYSKID